MVPARLGQLPVNAEDDFHRIRSKLQEMVTASEEGTQGQFANLAVDLQALQRDMKQFSGRNKEILSRLSRTEGKAAAATDAVKALGASASGGSLLQTNDMDVTKPGDRPSSGQRLVLAPLPDLLDAALDKHPADLSHLMDPEGAGGQTPLPFVSKQSLQRAVESLTDNFRSWLDTIYQSIITALQNKTDSGQVEDIARQVQDAAGRASASVASFAKRAIGGHCASCDAPLGQESMQWGRPDAQSSQGRWMPKSSGAQNAIRPPHHGSGKGPPLPACGASRLPKLQDLRQSPLGDGHVQRDFPAGRVLKCQKSAPQLCVSDPSLRILTSLS